jgi:hypothetical protein
MKLIRIVCCAVALIIISGCAAPSFVKPAADKLTLGKSTSEDIIKAVGEQPLIDSEVNAEKVQFIRYFHYENPTFWGVVTKRRDLNYTLFNNVMVGAEYDSTYSGEDTEFDTSKVTSISKGKSTRAEVIALLGKPSGEILYPLVTDKKGSGIVYSYTYSRFAGLFTTSTANLLVVSLNKEDVVSNISFKINDVEQIKN